MNPPKKKREKRVDEKATNDWCVCFIPDGLGEETNLYLAESFCDEEIKSFIRSHFISREKVEKAIEKQKEYFAATAKRYAEYAIDEENEINKKGWEKESDKNVASYNALSDLHKELLGKEEEK